MSPLLPVCGFKTSPCVRSKRPRVNRHHAHMFQHMCAWCRHARRRFECTHGGVLEAKYGFFPHFLACRNTHKHRVNKKLKKEGTATSMRKTDGSEKGGPTLTPRRKGENPKPQEGRANPNPKKKGPTTTPRRTCFALFWFVCFFLFVFFCVFFFVCFFLFVFFFAFFFCVCFFLCFFLAFFCVCVFFSFFFSLCVFFWVFSLFFCFFFLEGVRHQI